MYEWLTKLVDSQPHWKHDRNLVWTPELVKKLKESDNEITRAIDFHIDNILGRLITDIAIDTSVSYSEAEKIFFKGSRGKFLNSLKIWIKMLLCEKGVCE